MTVLENAAGSGRRQGRLKKGTYVKSPKILKYVISQHKYKKKSSIKKKKKESLSTVFLMKNKKKG